MAISSEVQVYNLALNAVGERSNISSPTERSRAAEVCNLWYSPVRDQILAAAHWPEALKTAYLGLVSEQDDDEWVETEPRPGYRFMYAMPSDALYPRFMTDFSPFAMGTNNGTQKVLYSNTEDAALAYTMRLDNIALWDAQLQMAIVYGLAANIAMPLSGKMSRAKALAERANELIWAAREAAANVDNEFFESIPDWIRARGYTTSPGQRFFFPYGAALTVSNVG